MSSPAREQSSRIGSAISREREAVRQQLLAAWKLQVFRVEEALSSGWQEHIGRVFEERFSELSARIEAEFAAAVRHRTEDFHRAVRRFATWENREQWRATLLDAVSGFCSRATLVAVADVRKAPALTAAIASRDTVMTLAEPAELSSAVAALFEGGPCAVVPVVARERVVAVLVAGGALETDGLEAIAALAGAALERTRPEPLPEGADEALFLRARRFARVRVAEMRLAKSQQVIEGRAAKRLYALLKEDIDTARVDYAREFLQASPTMPDYFHAELIRTLANDDIAVLGEEYPGPLA